MAKKKKRPEHVPQKIPGVVAINCIVNSKRCAPSSEVKVLSPFFGRNLAAGFKNEKKNCLSQEVVFNKKKYSGHDVV